MRYVPVIDATGLRALEDVCERCRKEGIVVILAGIQSQPMNMVAKTGLIESIGPKNLVSDIEEALTRANELLKASDHPFVSRLQ